MPSPPSASLEDRGASPKKKPSVPRFLRFLYVAAPLLSVAIVLGALLGVGSYTFGYAEGLSYLSTDPKACVNCHIMQPQYDGWQKASHHTSAVCVDCHLPQEFFAKYIAKLENGWRHGKEFTAQTFVEPIVVQERGSEILQANCVRCHQSLVHEMMGDDAIAASKRSSLFTHTEEMSRCVHCHATVGHGSKSGLGGPLRPSELGAH